MNGCRAMKTLAGLGLAAVLILAACSDDPADPAPEPGPAIAGSLVSASDCLGKEGTEDPPTLPRDRGFLFWSYDADTGTLAVDHVNAGLNCCPEYTATIGLAGDTLTIVEDETVGMCHCLCLFRFGFEVSNLPVGVYQVTVDEEYLAPEDPPLAGVIDLTQAEFGTVEAPRSRYPWDPAD